MERRRQQQRARQEAAQDTGGALLSAGVPEDSTEIVSRSSSGTLGNGWSEYSSISADGRSVAFAFYATNLVAGDTNWSCDVFVHKAYGSISGRVTISGTVEPLAGVLISAGEEITATTDVSGTYVLSGLPDDTYVVRAECPGYVLAPAAVTVTIGSGGRQSLLLSPPDYDPDGRRELQHVDFGANAPDFRQLGLEITQAVQDLDNSVPLVEGKQTWVRFYVHNPVAPYTQTVPASLTLAGDGVNGPVYALASDGDHVYIGGGFDHSGQQPTAHIACSTVVSNTIAPLDGGGTNGDVYALALGGGLAVDGCGGALA
ncbi:MAG: carboxypeptidase regulatory-like domain-containing protein [Anaerolineae bacterium]